MIAKLPEIHAFGTPYLPIPASPFPLPTRYHIRYGAPIQLDRGRVPADAADPAIVAAAADEVRVALERLITAELAARRGVFR